ncbi:transcriptional repressor [Brachybacterium sp. EF45031]|uniref:Fur family transcriptional regulator n=1 Tax=Brachybacterium sillae TaxID=2810536 RepID=UPI00217CDFAE|nr:Fur family transcriptional regulator [Brachybacterium sillae]MCS6712220.1 transcriptional repressor [Brachybacterium sillae]
MTSTQTPADALRRVGLRVTAPRVAALQAVAEQPHVDADSVTVAVRARLGAVSRQTVYDVLAALEEAGLVRRVIDGGRRALYEVDHHDDHHHVLCRRCGRLEDVPARTAQSVPPPASEAHGFTVDEVDVLYRGLCPQCAALTDVVPA